MISKEENVVLIPVNHLTSFPNHPFRVTDDDQMYQLADSIRSVGVLAPVVVRFMDGITWQLISGHRRKRACELIGIEEIPAIVKEIDVDEAIIMIVDSNFQRETILPSERAKAYKMKLDAMKRQGARTDLTSAQDGQKFKRKSSRDLIAENSPDSSTQIQRYICQFAELLEANGWTCKPEPVVSKEEQDRLVDAMEVAGMHYDSYDSSPDSLRFTSEMEIVTYFENWDEVTNWIEGTVFDDPEVEAEVDEILHPEKYESPKKMTALVVEPMKEPYVKTVGTSLEYLQSEVGGMIEVVYPFEDNVGLIMNEEGKLEGLPLNRGLFDEDGHLYDIIAGTFLVVGLTEDNFGPITPDQIARYTEEYKQPQGFVRVGDEIKAIPVEPIKAVGSFELYQLRDSDETALLQFESYDRVAERGAVVSHSNYESVYSGQLFSGESLNSIYERFNLQYPEDFRGHSLSVSDIIVVHKDGQDQAWYVDPFGFQQVPEFFTDNPLKKVEELLEDDYGMIDGIINNGDRRKDQEEKKPSVMERLQGKKKEAAEAEAARPKTPVKDKAQGHDLS